jgi:excisionase family DNA binding protein
MSTVYPDILTPDQAADYLQVNRETIYRYIRDGRLNASRIGRSYRIKKQSVEVLLAATSTRPDIHLRTYTDPQLQEFLEQDRLDEESCAIVRQWETIESSKSAHGSC